MTTNTTNTASSISLLPDTIRPPLSSGLTARAILLGCVLSMLSSIWAIHASYNANSSLITISHIPVAALVPFIIVALGLNPLLKRALPHRTFTPQELIIIFFLVFTASAIPGWAFSSYWLSSISGPYYFASPENRWVETFFRYLPEWLIVTHYETVAYFYEGLPGDTPLPWQAWSVPLFWWCLFFLAMFLVGASMIVMLRKQWVEHERLNFPLAQIPLALIGDEGDRRIFSGAARQRVFWIGFAVPLAVLFWQMLSFFDAVPKISVLALYENDLILARSFPPMPVTFNFLTAGVAFFTNTNVLFSAYLFFIIKTLQEGFMSRLGAPNAAGVVKSQHMGGFILFVLFTLWTARRHLRQVWLKAAGRAPQVDDSQEFLSYRSAVVCLIAGLVFIVAWLYASGMSLVIIAYLMSALLLMFIGVTRIVAEAGLIFVDLPYNAHDFTVATLGSSNLSPNNLTQIAMTNAYAHNWRTLGMCSMAHVGKVGDQMGGVGRGVFGYITMALALSLVTTVAYTLYLGYYEGGAHQFNDPPFPGGSRGNYDKLARWINNTMSFTGLQFMFLGVGGVLSWALIMLHYRFPGWPFHPIGFAVAVTDGMPTMAFSIFVAWLAKTLLLRFGGTMSYRRAQPLVIGMIAGYTVGIFLLYVVDLIWFPGNGHRVHMY